MIPNKAVSPVMIVTLLLLCSGTGCSDASSPAGVPEVVAMYIDDGINCETAAHFAALDADAQAQVIATLLEEVGEDGIHELLELGGGCEVNGKPSDVDEFNPLQVLEGEPGLNRDAPGEESLRHVSIGIGLSEWVQEVSFTGGSQALGIYRDGAGPGWMCNNGSSESPADFIGLFWVDGAYLNPGNLKLRGTNLWASGYVHDGLSSRVYSDNHVASCIGYWSVVLIGAYVPITSDLMMRR